MSFIVESADSTVTVEGLPGGKQRVGVRRKRDDLFLPISACETAYPDPLIRSILAVKGPGFLCDEILRDEDPQYVRRDFEIEILGYLDASCFAGRRILDFGCGCGSSSVNLARMFPTAQIVGVELVQEHVAIANQRAEFYGLQNVSFLVSPDGNHLPDGLGQFDFVVMSAVYEHLLPAERRQVLPLVWDHLKPGGVLFLGQTPNLAFLLETHTTRLPLINYLPDALALRFARRFCKRVKPDESWESLLRKGIRGGTVREILGILRSTPAAPGLLHPCRDGMRDRIDLWLRLSSTRLSPLKRIMAFGMRVLRAVTGITLVPCLSLAIRKEEPEHLP